MNITQYWTEVFCWVDSILSTFLSWRHQHVWVSRATSMCVAADCAGLNERSAHSLPSIVSNKLMFSGLFTRDSWMLHLTYLTKPAWAARSVSALALGVLPGLGFLACTGDSALVVMMSLSWRLLRCDGKPAEGLDFVYELHMSYPRIVLYFWCINYCSQQ